MGILDNLEAYLEFNESNEHSSLSHKIFQENVCKDCMATEKDN